MFFLWWLIRYIDGTFNLCTKFKVLASLNPDLGSWSKNINNGHVILTTTQFIILSIVLAKINLRTKFEIPCFTRSKVRQGIPLTNLYICLTCTPLQNHEHSPIQHFEIIVFNV